MAHPASPPRSSHHAAHAGSLVGVAAIIFLLVAGDAFGCPTCKDAVNTSDPAGLDVARGYFYSILIMLAMPCTLISSFGIYVWREMQRQKRSGMSSSDQAIASAGGKPTSPSTT